MVDVETTGLDPKRDSIIEIAIVRVTDGAPPSEFYSLVRPGQQVSLSAMRVHGITPDELEGAPSWGEVEAEVLRLLDGAVFVDHSANGFDRRFIEAALGAPLDCAYLSTLRLAKTLLPGLADYSLGTLCRHADVPLLAAHCALDDARATAQLLVKLLSDPRAALLAP